MPTAGLYRYSAGTSRLVLIHGEGALTIAPSADPFILGVTRPGPTNTGATGTLTPWGNGTSDYYVTGAGAVVENLDIYGHVFVQAPNVTVRNCRIRGRSSAGFVTYGLVSAQNTRATGLLVERCTIAPTVPQWWTVGVRSSQDVTVRRCNIYNTIDGTNSAETTSRMTAEGNWIHDLSFFDNSGDQANDA